jgi:hypothetical protein
MERGHPILIILPGPEYRRLADAAAADVREPEQQATFLLRRALGALCPEQAAIAPQPEARASGAVPHA